MNDEQDKNCAQPMDAAAPLVLQICAEAILVRDAKAVLPELTSS
ncbi:MAG: hypothetical protein JWR22_2836 [Herminiimonas sp.]|nr:hypothetical protein [Herminiimonas sp.]